MALKSHHRGDQRSNPLPLSVTLKEEDIEYICNEIISFSKKNQF